jgi:hypothetical protein
MTAGQIFACTILLLGVSSPFIALAAYNCGWYWRGRYLRRKRRPRMINWQTMGNAPLDRPIDLMIGGRRFTDCTFYPCWNRFGRKEERGMPGATFEIDRIFTGMPEPSHWAEIELPEGEG